MQQDFSLSPGVMLKNGEYRIERKLGQGGFGITYVATKLAMGGIEIEKLAIKELFLSGYCMRQTVHNTITLQSIDLDQFDDIRKNFIEEGVTLTNFNHPNIVKTKDIFEDNGTAYLVMQFVEGKTLNDLCKEKGPMAEAEALVYIRQIADALRLVHSSKMLHCDVKPDNIIITHDLNAVLIDFGISKQFNTGHTATSIGGVANGYAPIEQYSDKVTFKPTLDIHALSATLYRCVTGQRPISATERMDEELTPPRHLNPDISEALEEIILKGISFKASDRYQTMDEFLAAISLIQGSDEEQAYWNEIATQNTPTAFENYLARFPKGRFRRQALEGLDASRVRNEKQVWEDVQSTKTITAYEMYLRQYPNGQYTEIAKKKVAEGGAPVSSSEDLEKLRPIAFAIHAASFVIIALAALVAVLGVAANFTDKLMGMTPYQWWNTAVMPLSVLAVLLYIVDFYFYNKMRGK